MWSTAWRSPEAGQLARASGRRQKVAVGVKEGDAGHPEKFEKNLGKKNQLIRQIPGEK